MSAFDPTPHLDDDELNDLLDGRGAGDGPARESEHLGVCERCRQRLQAMERAAGAVAAPVAPPGELVRAAALRHALAVFDEDRGDAAATGATGDRPAPRALDGPGGAARPGGHRGSPGRRAAPRPWLAAAAVALLVVAAVPVLSRLGTSSDDETAGSTADSAQLESAALDGGDLGDLSDPQALAERVRRAVEPPAAASAAPAAGGGGGEAQSPAADETGSDTFSKSEPPPTLRSVGQPPCAGEVRSSYGSGLGRLVYTATVTWQGTPATVLVYQVDGGSGGLNHRVFVMARSDCRLLVVQGV